MQSQQLNIQKLEEQDRKIIFEEFRNPDSPQKLPVKNDDDGEQSQNQRKLEQQPQKNVIAVTQRNFAKYSVNQISSVNINKINLEQLKPKPKNKKRNTKEPSNKAVKVVIKLIILTIMIGIGCFLASISTCSVPIFDSCSPKDRSFSPVILLRSFKRDTCFLLNYTINTSTDNGADITLSRTNATVYLCIKSITGSQDLELVGLLKKISEETLSNNPPTISYFENQLGLQACLLDSAGEIDTNTTSNFNDQSTLTPEIQNGSDLVSVPSLNSSGIVIRNQTISASDIENSLNRITMFRMNVFRNGTINTMEFNKLNDNLTISQIPKMVKMFFPSLDLYLYTSTGRRLQSVSNLSELSGTDYAFNTSQTEDNINENGTIPNNSRPTNNTNNRTSSDELPQQQYSFNEGEGGTTLSNQQIFPPNSSEQVNAYQQVSSTSNFDDSNNLLSSNMQGSADLQSRQEQPSSDYQVLNINISISIKRNMSMLVAFTYKNLTSDNLANFQSYFDTKVVQMNNSLTMTEEQLKQYLQTSDSDENTTSNSTRLLLQSDGSLKLLSYGKQFKLLKTNMIGLSIGVSAAAETEIRLYELDQYKKQPRFLAQAYLKINLGFFKYNYYFFRIYKQFQPMSLSFTLEKIEFFMNFFKGDFIGKLKKLAELPSLLKFDSTFIPKLLEIASTVNSIYGNATQSQTELLPINQISTILGYISDIKSIIDTQGSSIIQGKLQIVNDLMDEISAFYNQSYLVNLNIFRTVQNQLAQGKINTASLINALTSDAKALADPYIKNVTDLMTDELNKLFSKQLANLLPLYQMFSYIVSNVGEFRQNLTIFADSLKGNFTSTLVDFMEEYYRKPINTFNKLTDFAKEEVAILSNSMSEISTEINSALTSVDNILYNELQSILSKSGYNNLTALINLSKSTIASFGIQTAPIANLIDYINENNIQLYKAYENKCFTPTFVATADELQNLDFDLQGETSVLEYVESVSNAANTFLNNLKTQIASSHNLTTKYNNIVYILYTIDDLENSFSAAVDKYLAIKTKFERYLNVLVNQYLCPVDRCFDTDYPVDECDADGDEIYYYRDKIVPVKNAISTLLTQTNTIIDALNVLDRLKGLAQYRDKIKEFTTSTYNQIISQTPLITQATTFYTESKGILQNGTVIYNKIIDTFHNVTEVFIRGGSVESIISASFDVIKGWTKDICSNQTSSNMKTQLKDKFKEMSNQILALNNTLFSQACSLMNVTLQQLSDNAFKLYTPLDLCNSSIFQEIDNIEAFINDTVNFKTAQQIILKLLANITNSQQFIVNVTASLNQLVKNVNKLANIYDFQNFIANSTKLVQQVRNFTSDFAMEVINIKQELALLDVFKTMSVNNTALILKQFIDLPSNLNALTLLSNFESLLIATSGFMQKINFDVLGTVMLINETLRTIDYNIKSIGAGCTIVAERAGDVADAFLNLTDFASQEYLLRIQQSFSELLSSIQDKVVGPVLDSMDDLNETISHLNISKPAYKLIKAKALTYLTLYKRNILELIDTTDRQFKSVVNDSLELIKSLKIGYITQVMMLGKDVEQIFGQFVSSFKSNVLSVSQLGGSILKDIFQIKGTGSVIDIIKNNIEKAFNNTIKQTKAVIDEKLKVIALDAETYKQLLNSTAYRSITSFANDIMIDFSGMWSSFDTELSAIRAFEQNLTSALVENLNKLSDIKKSLQGIKDNVENKIEIIKSNFKGIVQQFTKIERLIFGVLSNTMEDKIVGRFNIISDTVDSIFLEDLVRLQNLTIIYLPSGFEVISSMIEVVITFYDDFKETKDDVKKLVITQIRTIFNFLNEALIKKFQILKDGQNFIKSLPPIGGNSQELMLYQKPVVNQRIPIVKIVIPITTPIGLFLVEVGVNFYYGCFIQVGLSNFRDIYVQINFKTNLQLEVKFSYSLAIIQFGSYFTGDILNINTYTGFRFRGLIPVTMIKQIAPLAQFNSERALTISAYLYTQINALSFEVGGFVAHLWFKLIWIRIRFCIGRRWFRICFRFRFPIIVPTWKEHRFGYRFKGIQLAKIKVFDKVILKFRY